MTLEIAILFAVLIGMAWFFFTEKLSVELTAFAGLVILTLGGYVTPSEAFTGFASPAVITMLSVFFLSAALLHTGTADILGSRVGQLLGRREGPLIIAIMLVAGALSAFMNNIAAAAVLLPAVASISRKTGVAASRLFMPLSFGAILGGTTTLVGTPPNILVGEILHERGLQPFSLFDFTPVGITHLLTGVAYMLLVGRRYLPSRATDASSPGRDLVQVYRLHEALLSLRIPHDSRLDGRTLAENRLGTALGIQVVSILRNGRKRLAPEADTVLRGGDLLLAKGRLEDLRKLLSVQGVEIGEADPDRMTRGSGDMVGISARIAQGASLIGLSPRELDFRRRHGVVIMAIRRDGELIERNVSREPLRAGDRIIALGSRAHVSALAMHPDIEVVEPAPSALEELRGRLFRVTVRPGSPLAGTTLGESRVGELVGLTVAGIVRGEETLLSVAPDERILEGDQLLVTGEPSRIRSLLALGEVEVEAPGALGEDDIESDDVGVVEVTLTPRSRAVRRTLAEMRFRERYGLQALAVWREGGPIHAGIARLPLRFGDALLLQGPWRKIRLLAADRDFVVLSPAAQEARRTEKIPVAVGALAVLIGLVVSGWQPIHVAAFTAATFVVLAGAITMEEAYRAVEWRAVFLVAAILPVGIAMERTGAARLLSETVLGLAGPGGPYAVLAALFVLSSLLSQCLDGAPAVVLLAPVAIPTATELGISPYPVMMGIGLAASAAFMTPFSHKANLLVMGAGGYRVADYLRVGTPLTLLLLVVLVILVPLIFPL